MTAGDNKISAFVMSIVGVAVILAIGLIVLGEVKTSTYETDTITDEAITWYNDTNTTLSVIAGVDGSVVSLGSVRNGTQTIPATNYTFYASVGKIIAITDTGNDWNGTTVNVTYSFTNHSTASWSLQKNVTNLAKIPTWIGILITVALAFIVLSYFYGKAR